EIRASLQNDLARYRRSGDAGPPGKEALPEEIPEDVLLRFGALFRKASSPEGHLWLLQSYYEATKDFRLLETVPRAVLGQTALPAYPFLRSPAPLLALASDEATVDRLEARLRELCAGGVSATDRRALRLLEFLVERAAAAQTNGGGPHLSRALD